MAASSTAIDQQAAPVRIWDLPTRATHWLLVIFVAGAWATAEADALAWHRVLGYAALALVFFRLYWGFAGSTTARFSHFLRGPAAFWSYAKQVFERPGAITPGHNPMGGWSAVAMLGLLVGQIALGLFAMDDDSVEPGPLARFVSFGTGRRIAALHELAFDLLMVLIAIHVAVVLFYVVYKRDNLVVAMIGGFKRLPAQTPLALRFASTWHALVAVIAAALLVAVIANVPWLSD